MGAYGSPELPYGDDLQHKVKENSNLAWPKSYLSMYSVTTHVLALLFFLFLVIFGEGSKKDFFTAMAAASMFSIAANIFAILLCKIKKKKNNIYIWTLVEAVLLFLLSFICFSLIV